MDYRGKSYLEAPLDFKPQYGKCYIPERNTTTWITSDKAGFQVARFFPKSGHFILAGTPEGKALLYDVIKDRSLVHSYFGHTKAIRDIQFSHDGKHFLSCGFDNRVHYWDT
jgi:pre-mRNA-processing factor 17